jgi:electron transfer flavoprotein alpha subunit
MSTNILVVAESRDGAIKGITKETLTCARDLAGQLGGEVHSLLIGDSGLAEELAACGGARVLQVDDEALALYTPETWTAVVSAALSAGDYALVLTGHSYQAIDFFPRLAAAHDAALVPDVTAIGVEDGRCVFTRKVMNSKLDARTVPVAQGVVFASLQQGAFPPQPATEIAAVETLSVDLSGISVRKSIEIKEAEKGDVDLSAADVIVAGGRGVGDKDKFAAIFELAEILGAAVGASRPPCDSEWVEHERQIGSSGQVVAPKLYIALGISGAIQHLVGMRGSQCIVAVNKDPNAAIFQEASYGIVGDLHEVVPALIEAVREARG